MNAQNSDETVLCYGVVQQMRLVRYLETKINIVDCMPFTDFNFQNQSCQHTAVRVSLCQSHAMHAIQFDHVCVGSLVRAAVA